jgi:hypothetical protein
MPPQAVGLAECLIELEGPRGKMRIQWKGTARPMGQTDGPDRWALNSHVPRCIIFICNKAAQRSLSLEGER